MTIPEQLAMCGALVAVAVGTYAVALLLHGREATESFWKGYKAGVADERCREAEAARPIVSRLSEGPLLMGKSWDDMMRGRP